ncbi:MAG TPA: SDR family oxidoreductase [Novosphingobium sp.]|nr:SDR family oxidoreductase [Novosphingobium sp.]
MSDGNFYMGRVAVITGGARGFGKAFGEALAARGAKVLLVDVDEPAVEACAAAIRASGGVATGFAGDVTDETQMAAAMARAAGEGGAIDILINNAGLHSDAYNKPMREMGLAKTLRLFDVNVGGTITCTLAAVPYMTRPGASVVNISSGGAYVGGNAYAASKMAVAALSVACAKELAPVRVNAIAPGLMITETIRNELTAERRAQIKASMQFIDTDGAERHIVDAMLFLTSPQAEFVTGEVLKVGGGMGAGV